MVMIEALARGTPVVGTPMGAAPEIIDDDSTGYLRTTDDGLTQALLDVSGLDRLACREVAEKRFSMERMADDHEAVYRGLFAAAQLRDAELVSILEDAVADGPTGFGSAVQPHQTAEDDGQAGIPVPA